MFCAEYASCWFGSCEVDDWIQYCIWDYVGTCCVVRMVLMLEAVRCPRRASRYMWFSRRWTVSLSCRAERCLMAAS